MLTGALGRYLLENDVVVAIAAVFCVMSLSSACLADSPTQSGRPNIVVVLADDLGYGDLGCYGHPRIRTPHLDRFAAGGLKLTNCYAAHPNCSPSRAGLMTGRTPFRIGIYNWIPMFSPMHVRRSEITVATLLRNAGYDTCHTGKWHLNGDFNLPSQPQPWDHGFRHWFSTQNNALPNHRNPNNFVRNGKPVGELKGYAAELVAAEAVRWLRDDRDASKPFFLFVCFHEPHEPIASAKRFTDLYPSDDPSYSAHHGNVSQLDHGFGLLVDALEDLKLRENTFVFFTSDNGPAITGIHPHGSSGPLRSKKGFVYEGGIRVPGMIQWPGHVKPGSVSDEPVSGVDLLPTLCAIADVKTPASVTLDGASFLPVLAGDSVKRSKPLYWQFNRTRGEMKVAIREGNWKLMARLDQPDLKPSGGIEKGEMEYIKSARLTGFELYELSQDIAEATELSAVRPDRFERMKSRMLEMYQEVQDDAPIWPAWEWPRYESERIQWPAYRRRRR